MNVFFHTFYTFTKGNTYNWTEFEDKELRRILADTILTINGTDSYHLEAQMTADSNIIFRVFEYGYSHADRNRTSTDHLCILKFPEPKVIYLYKEQIAKLQSMQGSRP